MIGTNNKTSIMTGFKNLDTLTGGFKNGELILIGGRPAMGTTSFALDIVQNVALREKIPVAIFSLELSSKQIVTRLLTLEGEINNLNFLNLQSKELENLKGAFNSLSDSSLYVNDATNYTVIEWFNKFRATILERHIRLIIIDGISEVQNSSDMICLIKQLKQFAKELNVPIIAVSKLSRTIEEREDKKPTLDDLFPTTEIQEIYDTIMLLYREEYYNCSNRNYKNKAEIILAKHATNKNERAQLFFNAKTGRFKDIDLSNLLFDKISSYSKDFFTAQIGQYWYEIDISGNVLYKVKCQSLRRISTELLMLKVDNKEGVIDNGFNIIAGFKYSDYKAIDSDFKFFKFRKNGKWGLIDRDDNIIIQPKYDDLRGIDEHLNYLSVKLDRKIFMIDRGENIIDDKTAEKIKAKENITQVERIEWRVQRINTKEVLVNDDNEILQVNIPDFDTIPERKVKGI